MIPRELFAVLCEHKIMNLILISKRYFWSANLGDCSPCPCRHSNDYISSHRLCFSREQIYCEKQENVFSATAIVIGVGEFRSVTVTSATNILRNCIYLLVHSLSSCQDLIELANSGVNFSFEFANFIFQYEKFGMTFLYACERFGVPVLWNLLAVRALHRCDLNLISHISHYHTRTFVECCSNENYLRPQVGKFLKNALSTIQKNKVSNSLVFVQSSRKKLN